MQTAETEKEKHASMAQSGEQLKAEHEADQAALLVRIEQLNDEIKALRDQLQEQHQSHEIVMQKKLEDLQHQHRADLDDLCLSITRSRGTDQTFTYCNESNVSVIHPSTLKC